MDEKQQSTHSANLRTLGIVAIILLAIAAPIGLCTHLYISHKEAYLTERNLRLLSSQGDRLGQMIESYAGSVLNNNAEEAWKRCKACLELPGPKGAPESQDRSKAVTQYMEGLGTLLKLASNLKLLPRSVSITRARGENGTQSVEIEPIERNGASWLSYRYAGPLGKKGYAVSFKAEAQIADVAGTLGDGIFDDVFLILANGEKNQVIFQEVSSGPKLARIDTVKNEKGDEIPFGKITPSTGVFRLSLAGREHRLFLEPVRLSSSLRFHHDGSKNKAPDEMFLCGLVDAHRFQTESLAISYTWLLLALFAFLIVTASWPLIKLLSLRAAERLRLGDVVLVSISLLAVSGLLTFFLLDVYGYAQFKSLLDRQQERLASKIGTRFHAEVKSLVELLGSFKTKSKPTADGDENEVSILRGPGPKWLQVGEPYFENIVLVGMDGTQIGKWTVEDVTTPFINVSDRGYFKAIKEKRAWKLGESTFFIEPIFSKNTGKTLSALSMPGPSWKDESTTVVSLTAKLISLKGAVMPPGFGYAIIDANGDVLFHSEAKRMLVENLFAECDGNRQLRALAFAHTRDWVDASYSGRPHRLFVSPLGGGIPWTLVVFREKELAQTANLELLSASVILSVFYGLVFLLPALLYCFRCPNWIWPDETRVADYLLLLAVNGSLIALSLSEFFFVRHHHVPPLAFVLPPFALLLTCARLKAGKEGWQWNQLPFLVLLSALPALLLLLTWADGGAESRMEVATLQALFLCILIPLARPLPSAPVPRFLRSLWGSRRVPAAATMYLLLAGSLVVTLSALPVVVFYRSAYDSEMEIFVKHAQLGLAREIAARNENVKQEYGKVQVAKDSGYLEGRLAADRDIYDIPLLRDEQAGPGLYAGKPAGDAMQDGECAFDAHPFEKVLRAVRPLYNDTAVQTHELVYDKSADCSVQWTESREGAISLQRGPTEMEHLPRGSRVPLLARPTTTSAWAGLLLSLALLFFLIGLLVRWAVRRLFWIDLLEAAPAGVTDLDRVGESDDPARKEVAVSVEALEAGIAAAHLREECKRALRGECSRTGWLRRIGMDILAQPGASGLDARRLVADVLDRARAFYYSLWRGCTQEERLLLFDLAEDGFVNAKGDIRRRLIERGLVVRGSQLRMVNESFRAFVVEIGRAGNIHAAQEETRNPQRVMRIILGAGVVSVAFIVFVTQPQLWNLSTTFIGAVGAGIPSMMALLNILHGRRAQR